MVIEDLKKHLKNPKDRNQRILKVLEDGEIRKDGWYAGEQLEALRYYLGDEAKIIAKATEGSYQGDCFAIILVDGKYFLWRDSFGSCSGCDALDGKNEKEGYDYIIDTMNSVKEFNTIDELWAYLKKPQDYFYEAENILKELKKSFNENGTN